MVRIRVESVALLDKKGKGTTMGDSCLGDRTGHAGKKDATSKAQARFQNCEAHQR